MTNKTKTAKTDILKELNQILIEAYAGKDSYKNGFQKYLIKFFSARISPRYTSIR